MFKKQFCAAAISLATIASAFAQSTPGLITGQVPTAGQWNSYFAAKKDVFNYTAVNKAGDQMLGLLSTIASSAAVSGFRLPHGIVPTSPVNGDLWTTTGGMFARIDGVTVGPFVSVASSSFAATSPLSVTFPAGVTTYALTGTVPVTTGGTGLTVGTSGGVPCFSSTTTLASSSLLTANGVMIGGGAGACPTVISVGTNGQLLLAVTGSAPAFGTMSGGCSITNAGVITCTQLNGVAYGTSPSTNTVPVVTSANTVTYQALPRAAMATMASSNVLGNISGSAAVPGEIPFGFTYASKQTFFTAGSFTWTRPAGIRLIKVIASGAGGGGGGGASDGSSNAGCGGGGAAGGSGFSQVDVTAISSAPVVIGAAGAGGAAGSNVGSSGGNTTFNTTTVQGSGGGGGASLSASTGVATAAGGIAGSAVGDYIAQGGYGFSCLRVSGSGGSAGSGGSSFWSGGGRGAAINGASINGSACGSGGGGANAASAAQQAGGDGAAGCMVIEEYK